jgi:hypothetical protein
VARLNKTEKGWVQLYSDKVTRKAFQDIKRLPMSFYLKEASPEGKKGLASTGRKSGEGVANPVNFVAFHFYPSKAFFR